MLFVKGRINIADNSGGRIGECIKITRSKYQRVTIGSFVVVAVKNALLNRKVKRHDVKTGVIVRLRKKLHRKNGVQLSFMDNAVVLIDKKKVLSGTRVFGPVTQELRVNKYSKILSIALSVI